jgi:hypothetical protein
VFYSGDSYTARFSAANLSGGTRMNSVSGQVYDGLVCNLRTETVYTFSTNGITPFTTTGYNGSGVLTSLLEMNGTNGALTGKKIILSSPIDCAGTDYTQAGIFSGSDRIVVLDNRYNPRAYHIALPSGEVTDLGPMPSPSHYSSEAWAYWGVVECFSNSLYLVYVGNSIYTNSAYVYPIMRTRVPDGQTTPVQLFYNLADMASFTVSFSRQRWYFHHENDSQFAAYGEKLGYLPVTLDFGGASAPFLLANLVDQYVPRGSNASLAVMDAGCMPRTYQWYRDGNLVPDAVRSRLIITNTQVADIGQYFVVVSNPFGSVTSLVASLAVGVAPQVSQPPTNTTLHAGETLNLSVSAEGTAPLFYQWYFQYEWNSIYRATNAVLTLNSAQYYNEGDYYVVVSNYFGSVTSKTAWVTVLSPPVVIAPPVNTKAPPGSSASFSVKVGGTPPFDYHWYHGGNLLAGDVQESLVLNPIQAEDFGDYFVVITNTYGAATSSVAALIFIEPIPGTFKITALLTNRSRVVEHRAVTGWNGASLALASNYVFYSGDTSTARFNAADVSGGAALNRTYDYMVGNLRAETIYSLGTGANLITSYGVKVDSLIELDGFSLQPVGRIIRLSQPFTNNYGGLLCAGFDRIAFWDSSSEIVFDIALPSGQVTTYGPVSISNQGYSYDWASWGVAEVFNGALYLAYAGYNPTNYNVDRILRTCVINGETTPVALFSNLGYNFNFTVSLSRQRWYFHHDYSSQFGSFNEAIGYADAQFLVSSTNDPPQFLSQPQATTVPIGGTASLFAQVVGAEPFQYQWFFNGADLLGATNSTLVLTNVQMAQEGLYSLGAANSLGVATSQTAKLTVDTGSITNRLLLFAITNRWKFNQAGANLGTAWIATNYNDSAWPSGRGILAWEDNPLITPYTNTVLSLTNAAGQPVITYYFRAWVAVPNYPGASKVQLVSSNLVDDGAVFYLNGIEQDRLRLNDGVTISFNTFANASAPEGVYSVIPFTVSSPWLGATNLLAVEVHQNATNSSDVVFGMALYADFVYPNRPPLITVQPADRNVAAGQLAAFSVAATGVEPLSYQWWFNSAKLAGQTSASLVLFNVQPSQAGAYFVVVSNIAGMATSRLALLTVPAPPAIVGQPRSQAVLAGGSLSLGVTATGSPLYYQWWRNDFALASATNALLVVSSVLPADAGVYSVVVSNALGVVTSAPALVTVVGPRLLLPGLEPSNGAFHLRFGGVPGTAYELQASDNLAGWTPLESQTNLTGDLEFLDYGATNFVRRYYRLRLLP